jgi:hypothetical protein
VPDEFNPDWKGASFSSKNSFHNTDVVLHSVLTGGQALESAAPVAHARFLTVHAKRVHFAIALSDRSVGFGWEREMVDPARTPLYLVMPLSLVRDYQDGRPHYSLIGFCNMLGRMGCRTECYDLWAKLKILLKQEGVLLL